MTSNRIGSLALAIAVMTCAEVGYASVAEAHRLTMQHCGWRSGGHKDRNSLRGRAHYRYMRPAFHAFCYDSVGMGVPAYGCAAPGSHDYNRIQGDDGVGWGTMSF